MGKQRFYDTSGIGYRLSDVVEKVYGEFPDGIHTITGIKIEKANNGITSYRYQVDEKDEWYPSGFFRLFIDPNTVINIVNWLDKHLTEYIVVDEDGDAGWATKLLDDIRDTFIPENTED